MSLRRCPTRVRRAGLLPAVALVGLAVLLAACGGSSNAGQAPATGAPQPAGRCGETLQQKIDSSPPGAVLDLEGCHYNTPAKVTAPLTLKGGTLALQAASNPWAVSLEIDSDNVTLQGWTFLGGGVAVSINGDSHVKLLDNIFRDHTGTPIAMWGAVNDVLIQGNSIVNTRTHQSSAIIGRGSEGSNPCPVAGRNATIRDNFADQGPGSDDASTEVGWFGIELKCFEDVLIEGNTLMGGHTLISLPDSNRVTVRHNRLDLHGYTFWGVEIPKANDVVMEDNTVVGDGPGGNDVAFSANSGSKRMTIRNNDVSNVRTLVDDPLDSLVADNCLAHVQNLSQFGDPTTSTIERNKAC